MRLHHPAIGNHDARSGVRELDERLGQRNPPQLEGSADGRVEPWQEISPTDTLGVNAITKVMISQNAQTLVFNYRRVLSELFVVEPAAR